MGEHPGFRMRHVWAFCAIGEDDEEGVLAAEIRGPDGPMLAPLIASDETRLAQWRAIAIKIGRRQRRTVTLARFSVREDLEVVYKAPPATKAPPPAEPPATAEEAEALRCPCGEVLEGISLPGNLGERFSLVKVRAMIAEADIAKLATAVVVCSHCLLVLQFTETLELVPMSKEQIARMPENSRAEVTDMVVLLALAKAQRERVT